MAADTPVDRTVALSYLDEVAEDLDAVRRLLAPKPNRLATYHLQQAAEKLTKAIRLARGIPATKEHRLEALIEGLPTADPWRERLAPLEWLSAYATTYRYPSPTGKRNPGPSVTRIGEGIKEIEGLLLAARQEFALR